MKVFISWSGDKSKAVAEALREWLPNMIQTLEPWMSAEDIQKGSRWASDLASQLESSRIGLICLTRDNLYSPWILFEAGALSKTLDKTYVCPYLFDIAPTDYKSPLIQFQATKAEKEDTRRLIHTINRALGDKCLSDDRINVAFEKWWPQLDERLVEIRKKGFSPITNEEKRSDRELLEELLETVRDKNRRSALKELVGYCGVDSGQLIITDPSYLREYNSNSQTDDSGIEQNGFEYSVAGCHAATDSKAGAGQLMGWGWKKLSKEDIKLVKEGKLHASGAFNSAGVAVSTGFGDGNYPVYVEYESDRVKAVTVQFFE